MNKKLPATTSDYSNDSDDDSSFDSDFAPDLNSINSESSDEEDDSFCSDLYDAEDYSWYQDLNNTGRTSENDELLHSENEEPAAEDAPINMNIDVPSPTPIVYEQPYGSKMIPYTPPTSDNYPNIFLIHPIPESAKFDLALGDHVLSKLESCLVYSFYCKAGSKRSSDALDAICENIKISKRVFFRTYKRFKQQNTFVDESEEWNGRGGRTTTFPRTVIIQALLERFSHNGFCVHDVDLSKIIRETAFEITGTTPSTSSVSRMKRELMANPDVTKVNNPVYKTPTRFIAEHSKRCSIAYMLTVLSTHFFKGHPIESLHVKESELEGTESKISYDLARKILKSEEICHVLPKLLTSTDDTTVFVTSKKIDNQQHWYMSLVPKGATEQNDKQIPHQRAFFTTEPINDLGFRGFRVTFTKSINADGDISPGFVTVSGLNADCMPIDNGEDVQMLPLDTLGATDMPGYVVFVRKTDVVQPQRQTAQSENIGNNNEIDGENEIVCEELDLPTQVKVSKLYREVVYRPWIRNIRMKDYEWSGEGEIPYYLRAVSWYDGAGGQLRYLNSESTLIEEENLKITINKHSAARTGMEQACDVAPIFKKLRALIREMIFNRKNTTHCRHVRYITSQLETLPIHLPGWKKSILVTVLANFPKYVTESCTVSNVQKGFLGNGQIVSTSIPIPSYIGCLETLRLPYFSEGISIHGRQSHGKSLCEWFGETIIERGYIEESEFDDRDIDMDYNDANEVIKKKATIRTEGQQRAKTLSHPITRYRRVLYAYQKKKTAHDKVVQKHDKERTILRHGQEAESKILSCIRTMTSNDNASLQNMSLETMGTRGTSVFPSNDELRNFIRVRVTPEVSTGGKIKYFNKPTKIKRNELIAVAIEHIPKPRWNPQVIIPQEPVKPVPPRGVEVDDEGELTLVERSSDSNMDMTQNVEDDDTSAVAL